MKPHLKYMEYVKLWRVTGVDGVAFGRTMREAWARYQINPQHLFKIAA